MDEREELKRMIEMDWCSGFPASRTVATILAAGWRKRPEPGSAEWAAMVERGARANIMPIDGNHPSGVELRNAERILRAALGLDQQEGK